MHDVQILSGNISFIFQNAKPTLLILVVGFCELDGGPFSKKYVAHAGSGGWRNSVHRSYVEKFHHFIWLDRASRELHRFLMTHASNAV